MMARSVSLAILATAITVITSCSGGPSPDDRPAQPLPQTCDGRFEPALIDLALHAASISEQDQDPDIDGTENSLSCSYGTSDVGPLGYQMYFTLMDYRGLRPRSDFHITRISEAPRISLIGNLGLMTDESFLRLVRCAGSEASGPVVLYAEFGPESYGVSQTGRESIAAALYDFGRRALPSYNCDPIGLEFVPSVDPLNSKTPVLDDTSICGLGLRASDVPRLGPNGSGWTQTIASRPNSYIDVCNLTGPNRSDARLAVISGEYVDLALSSVAGRRSLNVRHDCQGAPTAYQVTTDDLAWAEELLPVFADAAAVEAGCPRN